MDKEKTISDLENANNELNNKLKKMEAEYKEYQDNFNLDTSKLYEEELENENKEFKSQITILGAQIEELNMKILQIQVLFRQENKISEINAKDRIIDNLEGKIKKIEEEIQQNLKKIMELENTNSRWEMELRIKESDYSEQKNQNEKLLEEIGIVKTEIDELNEKNENNEKEIAQFKNRIELERKDVNFNIKLNNSENLNRNHANLSFQCQNPELNLTINPNSFVAPLEFTKTKSENQKINLNESAKEINTVINSSSVRKVPSKSNKKAIDLINSLISDINRNIEQLSHNQILIDLNLYKCHTILII